jgi:pentatricopeptide repeat protein
MLKHYIHVKLHTESLRYEFIFQVTYKTLLTARCKYGSLQEVQQCLAIYQEMRKAGYVMTFVPCFFGTLWRSAHMGF